MHSGGWAGSWSRSRPLRKANAHTSSDRDDETATPQRDARRTHEQRTRPVRAWLQIRPHHPPSVPAASVTSALDASPGRRSHLKSSFFVRAINQLRAAPVARNASRSRLGQRSDRGAECLELTGVVLLEREHRGRGARRLGSSACTTRPLRSCRLRRTCFAPSGIAACRPSSRRSRARE